MIFNSIPFFYENPLAAFIAGLYKSYDSTKFINNYESEEEEFYTENFINNIFKTDPSKRNHEPVNFLNSYSYGTVFQIFDIFAQLNNSYLYAFEKIENEALRMILGLINAPIYFITTLASILISGIGRLAQLCYNTINAISLSIGFATGLLPSFAINLYKIYFGDDYYPYQHQVLDKKIECKLYEIKMEISEIPNIPLEIQKLELEIKKLDEIRRIKHNIIDIDEQIYNLTNDSEVQEVSIKELENQKIWLLNLEKIVSISYDKAKLDCEIDYNLEQFSEEAISATLNEASNKGYYIYYRSKNPFDLRDEDELTENNKFIERPCYQQKIVLPL